MSGPQGEAHPLGDGDRNGTEPSGFIGYLTSFLQRALAWSGEQAFRLPPAAWAILVVVSAGALWAAIAANTDWRVLYLAGVTVAVTATPLGRWLWLKRPGLRSSIVLARFGDEAGTHPRVMAAHLAQLQRRLADDDLLGEVLQIRTVNAAVNPRTARRILRHTRSYAVIGGSALVVGGSSRWEATLTVAWPETYSFAGPPGTSSVRHGFAPPMQMGIGGDYELPISTLTASDFPTNHADGIEASLLMIASWGCFPSISKRLLTKAEGKAGELPLALRAALENAKAAIAAREGGKPALAAEALERVGEKEVDHISLWNTVATMYLECEAVDPKFGTAARLRASLRALNAEPNNPVANFNVGIIHFGEKRFADAYPCLSAATERSSEVHDQFPILFFLAACEEELGDMAAARATQRNLVKVTTRWWERPLAMSYVRSHSPAFGDTPAERP